MPENDYKSALEILAGSQASNQEQVESTEEAIEKYDESDGFDQLLSNFQPTSQQDPEIYSRARGIAASEMQADQYSGLDRLKYGDAPDQQIVDPAEMISSPGQRFERGIKAGWGDLVAGTGDTIDWVSALVSPGEGDLTTSVGSYLKKVGTEYQKENALILSEDLQDITWQDMFKGEFWSSKISRLVPYAASFIIPYAGGSMMAGRLLGRLGPTALKYASRSGMMGKMAKGVKLTGAGTKGFKGAKGTGALGKLGVDLGKAGIHPTKLLRNVSGYIGGGATANLFEGAYLSGEAYQEMANDVDKNGNLMFTPEEAAQHAAGVMGDNAKWMGVDMLQYGILFGGAGRGVMGRVLRSPIAKTPFATNMKGFTGMLMRRVVPNLPAAAAYASIEAVTEGFQEVYQEWAKYKNIQQAHNKGYDSAMSWLKKAPFGEENPELRDIFWSSVGLGGAMGGARGYFDAAAERKHLTDKKIDSYNNVIDMLSENEGNMSAEQAIIYEQAIDNLVASNIWNYSGDGSAAMSIVDNLVKDNKLTEEQGAEYKARIELAERDYEKHHVNSSLTEAGAEKAFNLEMVKTRKEGEIADEIASYNETVEKQKSIFKDQTKLDTKLEALKKKHEESLKVHNNDLAKINKSIEDIYVAKVDEAPVAKSTGERDARFKKRLTKDEFETYTQEGEKQKTEREKAEAETKAEEKTTITEQVKEVGTKAFETVKDLGGKAVEGVKGLFGKAKEKTRRKMSEKEVKEAIERVKTYNIFKKSVESNLNKAKNWVTKNLESSKDVISEAIEKAKTEGKSAKEVIKELRLGKKIKGATKQVYEAIEKFATARLAGKEGKTWAEFIKDSITVGKEGKVTVEEKTKESDKDVEKKDTYTTKNDDGQAVTITVKTLPDGSREISYFLGEAKFENRYQTETFKKDNTLTNEEIIKNVVAGEGAVINKEAVKKKDKSEIVPKTEDYQKTEKSLQKGPRTIKGASIGKGSGANYTIKTKEGEIIEYKDFDGVSDKLIFEENQDVELRLKKPVKGQENVVEINNKLYFKFGDLLYESEIEVVSNGEVIGKVKQRDFKQDTKPVKKSKKKDTRKIDQIIGAVKESKEKIKKYLTKGQKEIPNYEPTTLDIRPLYRYGSGVIASSIVKDIVNKRFPGAKGVLAYEKLLTDFGEEASSQAIGSTVFINVDSVAQSDIIHEAGHIYYGLMEDTPLMKRIKKLLPKSQLYQDTKRDNPELTLMKFKDLKGTLGYIYKQIDNNSDTKIYTSDILDIVENLALAEKAEDSTRINDLFLSLRTQLKLAGAKDIRVDQQKHLLEETFTRTLESFSYGTVDAVVKGSAAQKQLEKDLIQFYKEAKKLATDEEAKQILDLTVEGIASLDLENAIKAILLNFNSADRTVPYMMNSAYGPINKVNKKRLQKTTSYSAVSFYIGEYIGRNLSPEEITNKVMQAIADDSNLTIKDELVQNTKDYVKAIITQLKRPQALKKADEILDQELAKIGIKIEVTDDVTGESESTANEVDKYDDLTKAIALPTTTTNFIKKIVEVYNSKQEEGGLINTKELLATLMSLAKDTQNDPYDFLKELRKSTNPEITAMLSVLDRVYKNDKVLTNAKLMEIKGPIEGINIEVLQHNVLSIGDNGERYWTQYEDTSATIEKSVIYSIAKQIKENKRDLTGAKKNVSEKIADIYNELFFEKRDAEERLGERKKNITEQNKKIAAKKVLDIILDDNAKGSLINKDILLNTEILFKGKRQSLANILFDYNETKFGPKMKYESFLRLVSYKKGFSDEINKRKVQGLFHGTQAELKTILLQGLVASRAINYLSMVDNVEQDGVSVFNKENGLDNRAKNLERIINEDIVIDKNDIMHPNNNIYSQLVFLNKNNKGVKTLHFKIHSGMMRRIINNAVGLQNKEKRAKKLNDVNPNELIAGDFFMFLNRYNQGIKNKQETIIYDQPIAVFSDKSRRYYVESIASHDAKSRKALLSRVKNNPAYNAKYKDGSRVFPYTIENNKIKEMPKLIRQWREYANNNKELFLNNDALKKGVLQDNAVGAFLTSYIANKFMAQQLFIHDHRQSDNQVDYIKRAAGSIASHVVFDRNTTVEFVVTKDYYVDKEGNIGTEDNANTAIENDAMGYVLPEQAKFIRAKYGEAQKVGNVFKFVYHYTQTEGPQKGRTTYMKFAVHTLTKELEATSPYLENIGDVLRARKKEIDKVSPGGLVMAASESAAKLYSGDNNYIYDIGEGYNMVDIMTKQDEIYGGDGKYQGLSGEGLGIQLELDKQTDERFFPSQLFYNLLSNITPENQATINRMLELRQNVMEANNASRNASLIMNDKATEATVLTERDSFKSSVTAEVFDVLVDNTYDNLDPRYPYLNAVHNSIATGRITHKGTKMYTKGSIGYQSSSLGMGLKSYEKGLYKADESIVASEAMVPGYLQKQGVKKGDLFIGTRVPAHGKVSSSVFVVKGFHKQIGDSPTSNVTIPAWVSKNWGADLDGDSVHMNFKWTPAEVAKKSWRADSNEFFDKYIELVSKDEMQSEIQADIDFKSDAENAIAKVPALKETDSQLTPWGDAQMFEDNVPAKQLVGMIASLQRSFNVFSNSRDELPFAITIKGESEAVTRETFFDDATLENGVGNWYGVAQLLNIALDNAKHQYASKLGMDMQSVFPYVLLRRLGYSLNDLAVLFNSPIVKKYMEFKRNNSKDYISRHSDIMDMFIQKDGMSENQLVKFAKENGLGYIDIKGFLKVKPGEKPSININLKSLKNIKSSQKQAILMLYTLDKFKEAAIDPISKAFTVHQSIEKNPLELAQILDGIRKIRGGTPILHGGDIKEEYSGIVRIPLLGKRGINYTFSLKTINNDIINHADSLFESILQRASRTDIRYTPYMQSILNDQSSVMALNKLGDIKSEVINQVIVNNLKQEFSALKNIRGEAALIKEFELLQGRNKGNYFLNKVIDVSERAGKKYIVLNRAEITEFTSYKAVEQIKESFAKLLPADKKLMFEIEYTFNRFGLSGGAGKATSFIPFFDNEYVDKINKEMSSIIEKNQTKLAAKEYISQTWLPEIYEAIKNVEDRKAGKDSYTVDEQVDIRSKDNNNIEIEETGPIKKPKKVITPEMSYSSDYLGSGVELMSFPKWVANRGIDLSKIEKGSDTLLILENDYTQYKNDLTLVKQFEQTLEKKPLSKYSIEGLYDKARKFKKIDNSATKGIIYKIQKEIAQKVFKHQSEYLRDVGASKGYEYNVPGEDGVPQDDLTNFQAWLGSNNMTSKRPEIQYLINEAQTQYRKYIKSWKEHKNLIEAKNKALVRSKMRNLSLLERTKQAFDTDARYKYIYGNIATVEDGNVRLYTPEEIEENYVNLTKEEQEYYIRYKAVAEILLGSEDGKTKIPGMEMNNLENMSRNGLFGLYSSTIDSYDYNRVKVYGTDRDGNKALKTFYEWKNDVYKGRTGKLTLESGKKIYELDKLRRIAKEQKAKGRHHDGTPFMLSDAEYDALVGNGDRLKRMIGLDNVSDIDAELIQEYEIRKGVKAENISYDINNTLLEFARSHIFKNGEGLYKMEDGAIVEREDRFTGMGNVAILTDSIIGFNKGLDNENAVKYLTGWWKEGFLEKKKQAGVFGKTGDKVIDFFVRLTSLRLLGFNLTVGIGNALAGKYQELRKRGGKQFIKGEARYWKDFYTSQDILKEHRVVEYSFDEFIHLSERKGTWGKIERWSYKFMDLSEGYIQGAAFLGMLTDAEYKSGKVSEQRVMQINHKISTLHGEGYTSLDASLLSMYSYGRAILQFKKWFITLMQDRFKAEDIDRFGEVNIGSYRASTEFVVDLFRKYFAGGITKKEIIDLYNNSSEKRKAEIRNHIAGMGIGVTLLSLIAMMEDDDEPDTEALRTLKKFSHDVFVTTDLRRFVNYTIVPASSSTLGNATNAIYQVINREKIKRTGPYGKAGGSKGLKTFKYEVAPYAELHKDIANILYEGPSEKKETSSLIR